MFGGVCLIRKGHPPSLPGASTLLSERPCVSDPTLLTGLDRRRGRGGGTARDQRPRNELANGGVPSAAKRAADLAGGCFPRFGGCLAIGFVPDVIACRSVKTGKRRPLTCGEVNGPVEAIISASLGFPSKSPGWHVTRRITRYGSGCQRISALWRLWPEWSVVLSCHGSCGAVIGCVGAYEWMVSRLPLTGKGAARPANAIAYEAGARGPPFYLIMGHLRTARVNARLLKVGGSTSRFLTWGDTGRLYI